jgi:hypothetical protein
MTCFAVEDTDDAASDVVEPGGQVTMPATDVPASQPEMLLRGRQATRSSRKSRQAGQTRSA